MKAPRLQTTDQRLLWLLLLVIVGKKKALALWASEFGPVEEGSKS